MATYEVGYLPASNQIIIICHDAREYLTPDEATDLANRLTDAVDQLDGRQ